MKFLSLSLAAILTLTACPADQSKSKAIDSEESEEATHALPKAEVDGVYVRLTPGESAVAGRKQGKLKAWFEKLRQDEKEGTLKAIEDLEVESIRVYSEKGNVSISMRAPFDIRIPTIIFHQAELKSKTAGVWTGEIADQDVVVTCLNAGPECDPSDDSIVELKTKGTLSNHRPRIIAVLLSSTTVDAQAEGDLATELLGETSSGTLTTRTILNPGVKNPTRLSLMFLTNMFFDSKRKNGLPAGVLMADTVVDGKTQAMSWSMSGTGTGPKIHVDRVGYDGGSITFNISRDGRAALIRAGVPRGLTLPQ